MYITWTGTRNSQLMVVIILLCIIENMVWMIEELLETDWS